MPLDGCHNLHRWSKDQAQRWQSGNLPSDPSIPGLLGFEKEEDLEETKVYIRRLWLATENAKASNPVFLDYNAAQLWKRTTELVNSLVRDEDKLCAELAKDEIIQTCFGPGPAGNKPRVCSAFLKDDIERILVYEGFGELIWGSRNIAASQLSNPYSGDDKRQPRWGACDQKGRYSANDQDTILLEVRHWVAARIQNKIKAFCEKRSLPHKVYQANSQYLDGRKLELQSSSRTACREKHKPCEHHEIHQITTPTTQRQNSPDEQLAREIYSFETRENDAVSRAPAHERQSSLNTTDEGTLAEESPSKIRSEKRKRLIEHEQLEAVLSKGRETDRKIRGRKQRSNKRDIQPFTQLQGAGSSAYDSRTRTLKTKSTGPTSECSSVDFSQFLDPADDMLSWEEVRQAVREQPSDQISLEPRNDPLEKANLRHDSYSIDRSSAKDDINPSSGRPHVSMSTMHEPMSHSDINLDVSIKKAREELYASLSYVLEQRPNYEFILDTLIPHAKELYTALSLSDTEHHFSGTFEQNELALVYWEALIIRLKEASTIAHLYSQRKDDARDLPAAPLSKTFQFTFLELEELKAWHREMLQSWPDRWVFDLELWTEDLFLFFEGVLGKGNMPYTGSRMRKRLAAYNEALWKYFDGELWRA